MCCIQLGCYVLFATLTTVLLHNICFNSSYELLIPSYWRDVYSSNPWEYCVLVHKWSLPSVKVRSCLRNKPGVFDHTSAYICHRTWLFRLLVLGFPLLWTSCNNLDRLLECWHASMMWLSLYNGSGGFFFWSFSAHLSLLFVRNSWTTNYIVWMLS
jgi:hypothetical protein